MCCGRVGTLTERHRRWLALVRRGEMAPSSSSLSGAEPLPTAERAKKAKQTGRRKSKSRRNGQSQSDGESVEFDVDGRRRGEGG